jgi:hypothetical protein
LVPQVRKDNVNRKLIIPVILAVLMMACAAYAQSARWVDIKPVRSDAIGGSLGDIDSHLPAGHQYRDADRCTWGHETVHGINAKIRIDNRAENGFYTLKNRGFICPSPALTLAEVASAIPHGKRGRVYNLYCVQAARDWNDTPLYVLDECSAYVAGSIVGLELNLKDRSLYSFDNACETWHYSRVAARMARQRGYAHADALDAFLDDFHKHGIHFLLVEYRKRGWR